ncbi:hypothetical protein CWI39_0060p0030 [Hamiltosporidium magnivora]|uniref:Uncharacterized protein n=1 Tax=Hamiltosporidium magnivora TaxID=148818 RepID=A0A4Q9LMP0_9MICR|nr:hypothetical protein CWI39_0060p0030 [Hamiltosporidium magnivora]
MKESFFVGTIKLIGLLTKCISDMNNSFGSQYMICGMIYGAMKKGAELRKDWQEDLNESVRKAWMQDYKRFCFITTNSMEDFFDFYYIFEPGFRCIKESIFDTIDFLITEQNIEEIQKQVKENLMKENIKREVYVNTVLSRFGSLVIEKLKSFLHNKFSQILEENKSNADLFENAFLLIQACGDNTKEGNISDLLDAIKSRFFLYDCGVILISKFFQFLYVKSKKDIYFNFFRKTNEDCIAIEKEKNLIYRRLKSQRVRIEYDADINNIFVPFSSENVASQYIKICLVFCTRTAEISLNLKLGKSNPRFLFTEILTDELKIFRPAFMFSESAIYFGYGFCNKTISDFIEYGGINANLRIFQFSYIDLSFFFPEFLLNYADRLIGSSVPKSLSEIASKEHVCISDQTKELIDHSSFNKSIWTDFLHEIYKVYVKRNNFNSKLYISVFEISLESFKEIYYSFIKELKKNQEMFLVSDQEIEKCREFFLRCILYKIKSITNCFKLTNVPAIDVEIIKA